MQLFIGWLTLIVAAISSAHPSRCDPSFLLEYFNFQENHYYLNVGSTKSCKSVKLEITKDFSQKTMRDAVDKLNALIDGKKNISRNDNYHSDIIKLLNTEGEKCIFSNIHHIIIGPILNVSILPIFKKRTRQLKVMLAESTEGEPTKFREFYSKKINDEKNKIDDIFTSIDMIRGLMHIVYKNNRLAESVHDVLQMRKIETGLRVTKIRTERLMMNISGLQIDPTGNYAYYQIPSSDGSITVYRTFVDHPEFTLNSKKERNNVFIMGKNDYFLPIDSRAVILWRLNSGRRSTWLFEGSSERPLAKSSSFNKIGCSLMDIPDPDGTIIFKIHRVRKQL